MSTVVTFVRDSDFIRLSYRVEKLLTVKGNADSTGAVRKNTPVMIALCSLCETQCQH